MLNLAAVVFTAAVLASSAIAQEVAAPVIDNTGSVENPKPTWETQKQARTFVLGIPAPRGQIVDRNGKPLAQTRLSYNLAVSFPAPLDWTDNRILAFARQQITLAKGLLGRDIQVSDEAILNHYKNRGVLPMDIVEDLSPQELGVVQRGLTPNLILRQTYVRTYPQGSLAGHIVGYTGREAPLSTRPIENGDLIFSESEGREGLEQMFDNELRGQVGQLYVTYDANGNKTSERIAKPPVPGYNVVTTLDIDMQRICEEVLAASCKRGAMVIIDPNTGEILAMASQPGFNPNEFVPIVRRDVFDRYNNDEANPLIPRAYRAAYPPGSTFKTFVGFAALETNTITPKSQFDCPTAFTVGDHTFKNWKKTGSGNLNFVEALTQSCNTWFYQVGIKLGAPSLIDYAHKLGLGRRTGIPLRAEQEGNIPTDDYMLRVHRREIKKGDLANMAIGQGDILISPVQMAQAMGVIASSGQFHITRLVSQIQSIDNKVVAAYPDRLRETIPVSPMVDKTLREALKDVVYDGQGTAHSAQVKGTTVAGKTGTAQWGPTNKQRTAAWFTGFLPVDKPQYAFAAVYEGEPNDNTVHGGSHAAPMIGKAFRRILKLKTEGKDAEQAESQKDKSGSSDEPATPTVDESN
ncbi:penicillin-binding protein 2 [Terrimicrobium sacchariphilum]|uniref:Penicillin-binding protein 2 n=1 Tax=Terrimicrobium sacchariphilum TaxID=690879 RepID=A0A146G8R1_TERSA|nr:penicillin-binding protein 2 [Terrimicrobium sacchariphilum]